MWYISVQWFSIVMMTSTQLTAVYKTALTVTMNVDGSADVDAYIAHVSDLVCCYMSQLAVYYSRCYI